MDFKKFLNSSVSRISTAIAQAQGEQPTAKPKRRTQRDELAEDRKLTRAEYRRKYSKKGKPFRSVVKFERHGPFFRLADKGVNRHGEPLAVRFHEFRVLHATKGWRVYHDRVPNAVA